MLSKVNNHLLKIVKFLNYILIVDYYLVSGWNQSRELNLLGEEVNALLIRATWSQNFSTPSSLIMKLIKYPMFHFSLSELITSQNKFTKVSLIYSLVLKNQCWRFNTPSPSFSIPNNWIAFFSLFNLEFGQSYLPPTYTLKIGLKYNTRHIG